jgi:hypothetical protein
VQAASGFGIQGIHHTSYQAAIEALKQFGVKAD